MAAPLVVKSTDAGAPVVAGIDSCIIALLDQYLLPLGWTKQPFPGINKAVYRPPNAIGNRLFYQVLDGVDVCGSASGYLVRSYEAMTDVDTGTGLSPISGRYAVRQKAIWGTTSPRPWFLIADGYGFWLGIDAEGIYSGSDHFQPYYTGECLPIFSGDAYFSVVQGVMGTTLSADSVKPSYLNYDTGGGTACARRMSGDVATIGQEAVITGRISDIQYVGSTTNPSYRNYPWDGKLICNRPILRDGTGVDRRGYLPGLYDPHHGAGFTRYQIIPDGSRQLMAIDYYGANGMGWMLIDISEGFRTL